MVVLGGLFLMSEVLLYERGFDDSSKCTAGPTPLTTPESWKGSPKADSPTRQWFSKVEIATCCDFEEFTRSNTLAWQAKRGRVVAKSGVEVPAAIRYRGTSLLRNRLLPEGHHRVLCRVLL